MDEVPPEVQDRVHGLIVEHQPLTERVGELVKRRTGTLVGPRHEKLAGRVVGDQQPTPVALKPSRHRRDRVILLRLATGEAERDGERGEIAAQRLRLLGAQPPHDVLVIAVRSREIRRQLRLADTSDPCTAHTATSLPPRSTGLDVGLLACGASTAEKISPPRGRL
jgi:hypothetical protein